MLSYLQAIVIALVQGITELFPVSSLGHSVLVPAWIGGSWETLVTQSAQPTNVEVEPAGSPTAILARAGATGRRATPRSGAA